MRILYFYYVSAFSDELIFLVKIFIDWLRIHPKVLGCESFSTKLDVPNLCRLVNRLVPTETTFTEVAKDLAHVILPEEKKLLGFLPLAKAYEHLL